MNAPDDELPLCWVVATLALDAASPAEPLTGLWILKDRIIGVIACSATSSPACDAAQ